MTDMDREIRYVFKMVDNVSQTSADISASTAKASENVKQVTTEQERLKDATDRTTASFTRQESQFIKTTAILMCVKTAAASVTHAGCGRGLPCTSTRHMRHTARDGKRG